MARSVWLALAGLAGGAAVALGGGDRWDVIADFSIDNGNPNGAWTYGWMPTDFSAFTPYVNSRRDPDSSIAWYGWGSDGSQLIWLNMGPPRVGVETGQLALHPGPGTEPCVARWTAPEGVVGPVSVVGRFFPGHFGVMRVDVRVDGAQVWTAVDAGAFDLEVPVDEGTTVDFIVYGGYGAGNTPLEVVIEPVCAADFNGDGGVNTLDVLAYLNAWIAHDPCADCDGNGTINTIDFLCYLNLWNAGC